MTPRVRLYAKDAARVFAVPVSDVLGRKRTKRVCYARNEVMRRLRHDGLTVTQIGRYLGRDHSTVIHGLRAETPGLWFG